MTADERIDADAVVAAWDAQHPAATDNPDWHHVLDELAHPETTAALYAMAEKASHR